MRRDLEGKRSTPLRRNQSPELLEFDEESELEELAFEESDEVSELDDEPVDSDEEVDELDGPLPLEPWSFL